MSGLDDAPEIIVVLGGGLLPDGWPDAASVRRAAAAAAPSRSGDRTGYAYTARVG